MTKTLILVRHAHRDTTDRASDNGLNGKGRDQAKAIRRFFMDRFNPADFKNGIWLVSSPKLRCKETLMPLAKALDCVVDTHPGLDEQSDREGALAFQTRIRGFLKEWQQSTANLTVVCSHGDWLPLAALDLLGVHQDPKKGSWLELEWGEGRALLKWYIPSFKAFYGF